MDLGLTSGFDPPDLDTERDEAGLPRQDTPEGGSGTLQGRHQGTLHAGTRQTKQTVWGRRQRSMQLERMGGGRAHWGWCRGDSGEGEVGNGRGICLVPVKLLMPASVCVSIKTQVVKS